MATGYRLDKGFLFDKRWEASMRQLSPKKFYKLFWELYDYQSSEGKKKVPEYEEDKYMACIASLVIPQINHRLRGSGVSDRNPAPTSAPTPAPTSVPCVPLKRSEEEEDKKSEIKRSGMKVSDVEGGAPLPAEDTHAQERVADKKMAYGPHGNVWLTEEEYKALTDTEGIPKAYIDHYSHRLEKKNYRPSDHAATIRAWWVEDQDTFLLSGDGGSGRQGQEASRGGSRGFRPRDNRPEHTPSTFDEDELLALNLKANAFRDMEDPPWEEIFPNGLPPCVLEDRAGDGVSGKRKAERAAPSAVDPRAGIREDT